MKRHPIPVGLYFLGLLLCLFVSGIAVPPEQQAKFESALASIDTGAVDFAASAYHDANLEYNRARGWLPWSCDNVCQHKYQIMLEEKKAYEEAVREQAAALSDAKSMVGLWSTYGVEETREAFWTRMAQGRNFASRQSRWDLMFYGVRSMVRGRDETIVSFFLRMLVAFVTNLTLGLIGAVVGFMWSLVGLIQTYQANIITATVFFLLASLAATSFASTVLLGLYAAAAGTVYVGAKLVAANLRLEDGRRGGMGGHQRMRQW